MLTVESEKKRRIPAVLQLNDASCRPGPELMHRLASRRPDEESIAIRDAWVFDFPVTLCAGPLW